MNQELEQEGATSSSRVGGWGRKSRRDDLTGSYDDIEQFNDAASTEDVAASEYRRTTAAAPAKGAGTSYGGSGAPCGACKFLRRKCANDCVFAPYFGAEHGAARFAAVHKIFGASNVGKLLQSIPVHKRFDAVITISYEAQARITNPVYGCVEAIADLQQQVQSLQAELSFVHAQLANSRQLAAVSCMALQQQQQLGGPPLPFLPFDPPPPLDPVHMQQLLCHHISSPPPTTASYNNNNRVKDEIDNPLQGIPHLYDTLPVGTAPTPSLAAVHMHPDPERHHLSLDVTNKNDDIPSQSSTDAAQLHALLRTRCLNLHETP